MKKVIFCYIGTTFNELNCGNFYFCEMPQSGEPTVIQSGGNAYFDDKAIEDKIPYELRYELKTKLYQTIGLAKSNSHDINWTTFKLSDNYAWMRFDFIYEVCIPSIKSEENQKVKVIKVSSDKAKAFLNELRAKKKENLDELERKFIYYFGNIE